MYRKCIAENQCLSGCELVCFDNTIENVPVTVRYNSFIDSLKEECWVCFCHEDWKADSDLSSIVESLAPSCIYGPIGVFVEKRKHCDVIVIRGRVTQRCKDGKHPLEIVGMEEEGRVDTFDCQCIIVHSSLLHKFGLRFDEALSFDMYVEDFCVAAYENNGIESMAVRIPCTHYSKGKVPGRFRDSLAYVRNKYHVSKKRYATIVGHFNTFGGDPSRIVFKWKDKPYIKLINRLMK